MSEVSEIIVCDTNVVIHLAIICPSLLTTHNASLKLVVHSIVKEEVHQLLRNPNKVSRLGSVLKFIVKSVPSDLSLKKGFGNLRQEEQQHRRIQKIEQGLA